MKLLGWTNPLPQYLVDAIKNGSIKVWSAKDYEYLIGIVTNPQGTVIEFK